MISRKGLPTIGIGITALLIAFASSAMAKSQSGGQASVPCGDGMITYQPTTLWPPNHKFQTIGIFYNEDVPEDSPDETPDALGIQITDITSSQQAVDDAGTGGCGPKSSKQGSDVAFDTIILNGLPMDGSGVITQVGVRSERCGKDHSPRIYMIHVTCFDEGTSFEAVLPVTVPRNKSKK